MKAGHRPVWLAPPGERLQAAVPHGHWLTTSSVAGLRNAGMVLEGSTNGPFPQNNAEQMLAPELRPGDIVVMDNPGSRRSTGARTAIKQGTTKLKTMLREVAERMPSLGTSS
ncbi:hypothetical protein JMJ56_16355 [Belnapia sp. T18]|uniref:Uncharacterized protein n=1 Tax=Belnapia arida TaxID=2804533 RepID=A0ABS1U4I0_9PROT|nr:hypothetical protein [Belnapia arida]MBL6079591.1 hypothetical protein [Belnapia arida]